MPPITIANNVLLIAIGRQDCAMQCPDGGSNEMQETFRNGTLTKSKDSKSKFAPGFWLRPPQKPRRRHEKKGRGSGSEEANSRGAVLSLLENTTPRSVHSLAREWGVLRNISRRINLLFSHRLSSCQNISVQPTLTLCVVANGRPKKRSSPNTPLVYFSQVCIFVY